jgi:sulfur carrier protein
MTVLVNGVADESAVGRTIADVLVDVAGSLRGSAVVVDGEVVPRGEWQRYRLATGQRVEVITAVQGG